MITKNGISLFNDRKGTLYWFNGLSVARPGLFNNILIMRISCDYGIAWTDSIIVNPYRNDPDRRNQPIDNIDSELEITITKDGRIRIFCDTYRISGGGTVVQFLDLKKTLSNS